MQKWLLRKRLVVDFFQSAAASMSNINININIKILTGGQFSQNCFKQTLERGYQEMFYYR